jgi:ABC-2 type transport system permease protein
MGAARRYVRLFLALARYSLLREMAFRGNFIVKMFVEMLWLVILLAFYRTIFSKTRLIGGWSEAEYLFFLGCFYTIEGLIEALFLENCSSFADLVRSGDLDFYLLKPMDEQFLVTCRTIEWSTIPNLLLGVAVMVTALIQQGAPLHVGTVALFVLLMGCSVAIAYSCLLALTSTAVWFTRNQSLFELWWLFSSLIRYPREIYPVTGWASPIGWVFWYVIPILLVVNVPAKLMVKVLEPWTAVFMIVVAGVLLGASRWFFRFSLQKYRSASS